MNKRAQSATLILMADSRSPLSERAIDAPYYALTAAANLDYAERHGYDFRFYQMQPLDSAETTAVEPLRAPLSQSSQPAQASLRERVCWRLDTLFMRCVQAVSPWLTDRHRVHNWLGRNYHRVRRIVATPAPPELTRVASKMDAYCRHPEYGVRAAPWGKLLAIGAALESGYERVVYIDSDAVFASPDLSLDQFLDRHRDAAESPAGADLTVLFSKPFPREEANSGFMIWLNTDRARMLLQRWWDYDAQGYHTDHDYEQHTLKAHLLTEVDSRRRIRIIPELSFVEQRGQFVRHVASPHAVQRVPRFRLALVQQGLTGARFHALMQQLATRCLLTLPPTNHPLRQHSQNDDKPAV